MKKLAAITALATAVVSFSAAAEFTSTIPMKDKGASTYYVDGSIDGFGAVEFMVDTGSGYMTINEKSLAVLEAAGKATYVKQLTGIMADGSRKVVPVYRLSRVTIGDSCALDDVEAAVFPGKTRNILGLSALKRTTPFTFSIEPATLVLSNCTGDA